jgi:SAM-dependent methyltransferase
VDGGERFPGLRAEYETGGRAEHYAGARWDGTAHARRTDRRERRIVAGWLERCGALACALDVPCGAGRVAPLLAARARSAVAVDAAAAMLRCHAGGTRVQASAHALPFRDRAFDLAVCSRLLHHLATPEQRRAVLGELARVSSRWLIASHFDRASLQAWRSRLRRRGDGRHAIAVADFRREAAACGWRERDRAWIARGISEQTWVLLERDGGGAP